MTRAPPSVTVGFDVNPAEARATRKAAFADAAKDHYPIALAHVYFSGLGHIVVEDDHYRWIPMPYVNDATAVAPLTR